MVSTIIHNTVISGLQCSNTKPTTSILFSPLFPPSFPSTSSLSLSRQKIELFSTVCYKRDGRWDCLKIVQ